MSEIDSALMVVDQPRKIVFDPLGEKELKPEASTKFPQTFLKMNKREFFAVKPVGVEIQRFLRIPKEKSKNLVIKVY